MDSPKLAFQRLVENLLDRAVDGGLESPIIFVMVSVNGYISAVRYSRRLDGACEADFSVEGSEPPEYSP